MRMEPYRPVLRVLGHLENVKSYVDKANMSGQLQKVHYLHVLVKALKPEGYSMNWELLRTVMATFSPVCCLEGPCWGGTSPTPGSLERCSASHGTGHRLPDKRKCINQWPTKSIFSPFPGLDPSLAPFLVSLAFEWRRNWGWWASQIGQGQGVGGGSKMIHWDLKRSWNSIVHEEIPPVYIDRREKGG